MRLSSGSQPIGVRPERPTDAPAVRAIHLAAFPTAAEADLVDRLRAEGDAALAFVAETPETVVGHVLLSPLTAPMPALALAPLAVHPSHQRQGVGRVLIESAIAAAGTQGWEAVLVLGEPSFYGRFGFSAEAAEGYDCAYAGPYLMLLPLSGHPLPKGRITYARAFADLG